MGTGGGVGGRAPPLTGGADHDPADIGTVREFHALYYRRWLAGGGTLALDWLGTPVLKCPMDLWIYQELIWRRRPGLIVETGTYRGGSAHYLACLCDLVGTGSVVTIDRAPPAAGDRPEHPRLAYWQGDSAAPDIIAAVAALARDKDEVMVILDSDHAAPHVFRELEGYAPLIRPGGYLIAEDTNVNGNPVLPEHGPGPREAVALFLAHHPDFAADPACERLLLTLNPGGYLVRR